MPACAGMTDHRASQLALISARRFPPPRDTARCRCLSGDNRNPQVSLSFRRKPESRGIVVIPAKAGIHGHRCHSGESRNPGFTLSIPACRGQMIVTIKALFPSLYNPGTLSLNSSLRWNDGSPGFAACPYFGPPFSASARYSQVSMTVSGLRERLSMPSSSSHLAKSRWSEGP